MDNKTIETLSVNAVIESTIMSGYSEPYIHTNDKEPSFDGNIYIYNKNGQKNRNMAGRIAVQIKGKNCNDLSKKEISYSVRLVDLNNFLSAGGVMFFVVYISDSMKTQIYYCSLLPVKLGRLIREAEGQKTKTVKFKSFPTDNNGKRDIFINYLNDYRRQASFIKTSFPSLEELKNSGKLIDVKVYVSVTDDGDYKGSYFDNEVYAYAETEGSDVPQPLDILPDEITKTKKHKATIRTNGKEWYSEYSDVNVKNERYLQIGKSFRIRFSDDNKFAKITYKNSNKLRTLVKDLDFFLAFIDCGELYINSIKISYDKRQFNLKKFNVARQKERLIYLKKVICVLDQLGYKGDLNIDKLSEKDRNNINGLVTGLIEKKSVHCKVSSFPLMVRLCVVDAVFGLHLQEDGETPGAYKFYDFFKTEIPSDYIDETGDKVSISQYAYLTSKDLCELSNLRTDVLLPSFKKYSSDKDCWYVATVFLLKLLHAYDLSNGEKPELLDAAFQFGEWVEKIACEDNERLISRLNYLQIIKRSRLLNQDELNELWDMVDDEQLYDKNKVEIYLLLDNQPMAEHCFKKLDIDQQLELAYNPIFSDVDFINVS